VKGRNKVSAITARYHSAETRRILRFMMVGAASTIHDCTILSILKGLGVSTLPANTFSYLAGSINTFYWNRRWTFACTRSRSWSSQFLPFFAINLVGLFLSSTLTIWFESALGGNQADWNFLTAKLMATGLVMIWNYSANRYWTFGKPDRQTPVEEKEWIPY
jgi:putative flippase GtrA